jgi:NAD(P)-dependent dehydrogenase (short-subunit alcohol dehydrogenase family)
MFNPDTAPASAFIPTFETAARSLKVAPIVAPVHSDAEIETAITALGREPGGGLVVMPDVFMNEHRASIISAAARNNVPAVYTQSFFFRDGGLLSYGVDRVRAMLVATREAVKLMPDGGRIIAITYAPGGRTGTWAPWVAMGSAKAALESLCRYFAVALAMRRITVNAVSPGATEDSVFNTLPPEVLQMLRKWAESGWVPMRRLTTPADVGNVVALLCSEEAGFVTGQLLHVDGGCSLAATDLPLELQAAG